MLIQNAVELSELHVALRRLATIRPANQWAASRLARLVKGEALTDADALRIRTDEAAVPSRGIPEELRPDKQMTPAQRRAAARGGRERTPPTRAPIP